MNENRLASYLDHILEATQQACSYIEGMSKQVFLADLRTQQATILNIVVIGEAATRLLQHYPAFLERHPQVPWRSMKGMRNRIAHGYFDIDTDVVWETVKNALPDLLRQLPAIRKDAESWTHDASDG